MSAVRLLSGFGWLVFVLVRLFRCLGFGFPRFCLRVCGGVPGCLVCPRVAVLGGGVLPLAGHFSVAVAALWPLVSGSGVFYGFLAWFGGGSLALFRLVCVSVVLIRARPWLVCCGRARVRFFPLRLGLRKQDRHRHHAE